MYSNAYIPNDGVIMLYSPKIINIDDEINCANCGKDVPQYMPIVLDNGMAVKAPRKYNYIMDGYIYCEYCWLSKCSIPVKMRDN
jgi:hypothetical protein